MKVWATRLSVCFESSLTLTFDILDLNLFLLLLVTQAPSVNAVLKRCGALLMLRHFSKGLLTHRTYDDVVLCVNGLYVIGGLPISTVPIAYEVHFSN